MRFLLALTALALLPGDALAADSKTKAATRADNEERRFFLFVTPDPPLGTLVETAHREAQSYAPTVEPKASREALSRAYPRLFDAGRSANIRVLETELKAGANAHYNASFAAAEGHLSRALEFAYSEPEALTSSPAVLNGLADAAALRYKNALALDGDPAKAMGELERFARRFPTLAITTTDHPPNIVEAWETAQRTVRGQSGSLALSVHPVELERSGDCELFVNGVRFAGLPLGGPVRLPRERHQIQVRCGNRTSWLQNVDITERGVSLVIPVRAMLGARGDFTTGGLVLVAPSEGDASNLVTAVSQASEFAGAVLLRATVGKIELGRQDLGTAGPSREAVGRLEGDNILALRRVEARSDADASSGSGVGPWQWVTGAVGVAGLATGIVANVMYVNDFNEGRRDRLDGLGTASLVGYVAGGALLATSVVLFILDASSSSEPARQSAFSTDGGGMFRVRF